LTSTNSFLKSSDDCVSYDLGLGIFTSTVVLSWQDLEEAIFLGDKVHIVTTRPCQLKKTVEVKIPRPRSYETQSSEDFRKLLVEVNEAVHEEAVKAFQAGERELA
jgi:NitT/TauT family transport system ATP-binding protein